jgi:hypothetical protein
MLGFLAAETGVEFVSYGPGGSVATPPGQTGAGKSGGSMSMSAASNMVCLVYTSVGRAGTWRERHVVARALPGISGCRRCEKGVCAVEEWKR